MRFSHIIEEYARYQKLSSSNDKKSLSHLWLLCVHFRNPDLSTISDSDVVEYLNFLLDLGWAHNHVVLKSAKFRTFWKWLNMKGYETFNHELIPAMKKVWVPARVATEDQYRAVIGSIDGDRFHDIRDKAIIMLLWDTGARCGEICSLNVLALNLQLKKAVIRTEKSRGKKPFREIFWTEETNASLMRWIEVRDEYVNSRHCDDPDALFIGASRHGVGARLGVPGIEQILRVRSHKAKVPILNPHSFRHHMGHDLADKGASNTVISSILGHSNLQSSFRYTDLNDQERERAYRKFKEGV
jgi:site-specific recombinase XerD